MGITPEQPLSDAFGPFGGHVWLNSAHQGPLPAAAQEQVLQALADKVNPGRISPESFVAVPIGLRSVLAQLLSASPDDILLANSTTHTLNLVAQGLPWKDGDEVLCVAGDFPASVLPWVALRRRGVRVRFVDSVDGRVDSGMVAAALTPRTRVVCMSWVFSFFGCEIDVRAIGEVCRAHGSWFVLNGSQAVGARPFSIGDLPVDALACCGWKWLCGPYATGFGWLSESLRAALDYPQPHWMRFRGAAPAATYELPDEAAACRFDVFCSANFLGFQPLAAAISHLLDMGIDRIAAHDQALVQTLIDGLAGCPYRFISPLSGEARSTLVVLSHHDDARNESIHQSLAEDGVRVAYYNGCLRISPHLFNTASDIERVVASLARAA